MSRREVAYEDEFVTEYKDGSTECRFTSEEWEIMLSDPSFGYVCGFGHFLSDADHRYGSCLTCEHLSEYDYDEYDEIRTCDYVVSYRIDYDNYPSDTGTVVVEAENENRARQVFYEKNLHRYLMMDYADVVNVVVTGASIK